MKKYFIILFLILTVAFPNTYAAEKVDTNKYENYKPYRKKIDHPILATKKVNQNGIQIVRNTIQPKSKVKERMMEYEFLITNKTGTDIVINKVDAPRFLSKWGVAGKAMIPQGKDFIPVVGLVEGIKTDVEKNRFMRKLPEEETIKKDAVMRILAMGRKGETPSATFYFTKGKQKIKITVK